MKDELNLDAVRRAMGGDKQAFAELCEHKAQDILYICIKLTGSTEDGKDAAQEVLLAMQRGIKKLENAEAFPAWLNQIIRRTCIRVRSAERRAREYLPLEGVEEGIMEDAIEFLPLEFAERKDSRETVLSCMNQLPTKYQHILLLFYFEEMSLAQIAEVMGTNPNAARAMLHRARNSLKKRVEKSLVEPIRPDACVGGLVPTLALILRKEAAQLATEESAKKILAASGVAAAGGMAVGAAGAAAVAGGAAAGGISVAGVLGAAASLVVCGSLVAGTLFLADSSLPADTSHGASVPQPVHGETAEENGIYSVLEGSTILEGESSNPDADGLSEFPVVSTSETEEEPTPQPPAAGIVLAGHVQFVDGDGAVRTHAQLDLSGIEVLALQNGQVVGQATTTRTGAYTLEDLPAGSITLVASPSASSGLVAVEPDGAPNVPRVTDSSAPLASIRYCRADGSRQSGNRNPAFAQFATHDGTPVTLRWYVYKGDELLSQGSGERAQLNTLTAVEGRLSLVLEATDLAGNTTRIERALYLS